jgi:signal transduction histidine kinase
MARNTANDAWLGDLPPTGRERRTALVVAATLLVGFAAVAPFAGTPLAELNAFFPSLDAIALVTSLITSVLLFAQLSVFFSSSLLVLASGYLFAALILIPHALTFSGAFTTDGLLHANIQTGSWLFIFWHVGFAIAVCYYAAFKIERPATIIAATPIRATVVRSAAILSIVVCGLTWLATAGVTLLPSVILDDTHISPFVHYPIGAAIAIFMIALVVLALRGRSVLDQWLMVVALASILELILSGFVPTVRFSLGFYAGRMFSLATSSIVLIAMLGEITRLYVRQARAHAMLRREQDNKLMNLEAIASSISHEIRQPVGAMVLNAESAVQFITREPPDIAEAVAAMNDVVRDGERTHQMLMSIRALFARSGGEQELIYLNESVLSALRVLFQELRDRRVTARVDIASGLPPVSGHRGQLQEVFVNLFQNAMEAMEGNRSDQRILTVRIRREEGGAVIAEVEDSGPGISREDRDRIFDAFVTTKPDGMGLGLAICRMIIERHGGQLSVWPAHPRGTMFRVVLPEASSPLRP